MIQIGAKPDAGFDDPIGMLKDCHRRIESFLGVLCLVVQRARGRALTEEEISAVESALRYFRIGGERHNADEEESLFPRLREDAAAPSEAIHLLESEHRSAGQLHALTEQLYRSWIALGTLNAEKEIELLSATAELKTLYEAHIATEETLVFPHAAKVLGKDALAAIGREFKARRA